jgi:hypothetical protein
MKILVAFEYLLDADLNMNIIAIGDIHGKTVWRKIVDKTSADVIVFVGDFVIIKQWLFNSELRLNLEEIIHFKKANFKRVRLLVGNHDVPYVYGDVTMSKLVSPRMGKLYRDNFDCFDVAFQHNQYLFTHAGISKGWFTRHENLLESCAENTLASKLNAIHRSKNYPVLHERGWQRGGQFAFGGITYADKSETECNGLDGFVQIVGHTKVSHPVSSNFKGGSVIYIDCLNTITSYLSIDERHLQVKNVNGSINALPMVLCAGLGR